MSFVNLEKGSRLEKCRHFGSFATATNVARLVGNTRAETSQSTREIIHNNFKISLTVFLPNTTRVNDAITSKKRKRTMKDNALCQ